MKNSETDLLRESQLHEEDWQIDDHLREYESNILHTFPTHSFLRIHPAKMIGSNVGDIMTVLTNLKNEYDARHTHYLDKYKASVIYVNKQLPMEQCPLGCNGLDFRTYLIDKVLEQKIKDEDGIPLYKNHTVTYLLNKCLECSLLWGFFRSNSMPAIY